MKDQRSRAPASVSNIYRLDGRVPVGKAIPFGLQHVLAMFVANVTPVMLIASVAVYNGQAFTAIDTALLIQAAMLMAGIGTLIQLYPVWRIGSRLPVVMGLSFTFLSAMMTLAAKDYGLMIGAVIVGGCIEGLLGLTAKYWRRFVSPIVSACVVTTIGFSLLSTGISSFASSSVYPTGAWQNLLVAVITLAACLVYNSLAKGFWKQLYVLFGLIVGYIVSLFFGMVDFASMKETVSELGIIALPKLFAFTPKFDLGAIISVTLVFLVSAAETIGDTSAVCTGGLGRDITEKEVSGSLACDGFISAVSGGVFGCPPITSFSQNVGLVAMTKVVNRFTIMFGALTLILAGLFPPVGAFFSTLPDCVLGGCTVIMFGAIIVSGVTMLGECGFDQRNTIIAATSFAIGIGVTQVPEFFSGMPQIISDIFAGNPVAGVFVISMILSLTLPKKVKMEDVGALTEDTIDSKKPEYTLEKLPPSVMQHMTEGGFGRLQIVRVLDRDVKLVHRKAGPAALWVGKTGLLGEDLRNEIRTVFSVAFFHAAPPLFLSGCVAFFVFIRDDGRCGRRTPGYNLPLWKNPAFSAHMSGVRPETPHNRPGPWGRAPSVPAQAGGPPP